MKDIIVENDIFGSLYSFMMSLSKVPKYVIASVKFWLLVFLLLLTFPLLFLMLVETSKSHIFLEMLTFQNKIIAHKSPLLFQSKLQTMLQ